MTNDPVARVLGVLDGLGIRYERVDHPPVFTVEEAVPYWRGIDATHCKNLFLRNKKGNRHYLVVVAHDKAVDLRRLAGQVGDDRLSFASPERLAAHLGLTPGAVSPFGLINDTAHAVQVVVDSEVRAARRVAFHPNANTSTLALSEADFERFLVFTGHALRTVRL